MAIEVPSIDREAVIKDLNEKLAKATLEATEYRVLATQLLDIANKLQELNDTPSNGDEPVVEGEVVNH